MYSSTVSVGDIALASQYVNLRKDAGLFSGNDVQFTYDNYGRIATIVHNDYAITLTFTYDTKFNRVLSLTDGTNTWTFTYETAFPKSGLLTRILKS